MASMMALSESPVARVSPSRALSWVTVTVRRLNRIDRRLNRADSSRVGLVSGLVLGPSPESTRTRAAAEAYHYDRVA